MAPVLLICFTFDRQAMGAAIPSRVHYSFADSLLHENQLVIQRENSDLVYRGEVTPDESCAAILGSVSDSDLTDVSDLSNLESESDRLDQLAPSSLNLPSSPDPLPGSSPAQSRDSTPGAEHLSSLHTPYRRIITYAARDRRRLEQNSAQSEGAQSEVHVELRRSSRLQAAAAPTAFSADPDHGPLVDHNTLVMAAVAGAPKNSGLWWEGIHRGALKALNRVFRDFDFGELRGDSRIRFGITFGEEYAAPLVTCPRLGG
ncbi:hypothetical protein B0H14DRAFT_3474595 [Mycena olivaceomarginata]|nr:hypothetical protein B0H14DRAFT_3474595 [Mycena olivaceomarginata]